MDVVQQMEAKEKMSFATKKSFAKKMDIGTHNQILHRRAYIMRV